MVADNINASVDLVVTWVDGSDPAWQKERQTYADSAGDQRELRFRDWDLLRYWFRGVEAFMPWVRNIVFVTWGHVPAWLETTHPRLRIVRHADFIPAAYLPTFNSNAIEWNLHRIKGLSDCFVYSNDDFFPIAPIRQTDCFVNGLPRECAAQTLLQFKKNGIDRTIAANLEVLNAHFEKHYSVREHIGNWFYPAYGKYNLYNLYLYPFHSFTGFRILHSMMNLRKHTLEELWEKEEDILDQTCRNRFRTPLDLNIWLASYWQMASNQFRPKGYRNSLFVPIGQREQIQKAFQSRNIQTICLNDDDAEMNVEEERRFLNTCFESLLPKRSSFEKNER